MSAILKVDGLAHGGWESIEVTRSLEQVTGTFSLSVSDRWPNQAARRTIRVGQRCTVTLEGFPVIAGWVDEVAESITADAHTFTVSGRDATGDLVDCSAIQSPGVWKNVKLEVIAAALCAPFGVSVTVETSTGAPFGKFAIEQGESVFDCIERMCRLRAVIAASDAAGNLVIKKAGAVKSGLKLSLPGNIKALDIRNSGQERFSVIRVKGQSKSSDENPAALATTAKGQAVDAGLTRYRPLLVMAEGQASAAQCQERAAWELAVRKGRSEILTVTVAGWRTNGTAGNLWQPDMLVKVDAAALGLSATRLISQVVYRLDSGGQVADLTLLGSSAFAATPAVSV